MTKFSSERCEYREFGVYEDGQNFAVKHPALFEHVLKNDIKMLMSSRSPLRKELRAAIRELPEFKAYRKTVLRDDFFFAAFPQTARKKGDPKAKRTGANDVERFIIERIQSQYEDPRKSYEFVVEAGGKVVGYVELFDSQPAVAGLQFERGIFITSDQQAHGYGKEAIIALTDYAFKVLGSERIFTMADPDNVRSVSNITKNSGGEKVGEADSKYAHLDGGGTKRELFHIYPEKFYGAVEERGNTMFLIRENADDITKKPAPDAKPAPKTDAPKP
ncbi:MAG: GNAT family N-acetyltransferase [Alphaproteobacteria bacterium]